MRGVRGPAGPGDNTRVSNITCSHERATGRRRGSRGRGPGPAGAADAADADAELGDLELETAAAEGMRTPEEKVNFAIMAVMRALQDDSLPSEAPLHARFMLSAGLPQAVTRLPAERHALAHRILGYVREVLEDISSRLLALTAFDEARAAGLAADLAAQAAAAEESCEAADAAALEAQERGAQLSVLHQELKVTQAELRALAAHKRQRVKERERAVRDRERCEALRAGSFEGLGIVESDEGNERKSAITNVRAIVKDFERLGAEAALLAALPAALRLAREARRPFDEVVVAALHDFLAAKAEEVEGRLVSADEVDAELEEEASAKSRALEEAAGRVEAAEARLRGAEATGEACAAAHRAAEARVEEARSALERHEESGGSHKDDVARMAALLVNYEWLVARPAAAADTPEALAATEPAAEDPAEAEPAAEEPVEADPATEEPAAEDPAAEEPEAEEPNAEEPAAEEPAADEPAAEENAAAAEAQEAAEEEAAAE